MAEEITRKDSWYRKLKGGIEVFLIGETLDGRAVKIRASGPEESVMTVVESFEEWTGKTVEWEGRPSPPTGSRPIPGQTTIMEQLESVQDVSG